MKSPRTYTADQKQAAIRRVLDIGPAAASKELGIPSGTLSCWAHKARQGVAGYALPRPEGERGPEPEPASEPEPAATPEPEPAATPEPVPAPGRTMTPQPASSRGKVARVYTPSEKARALELAAKVGITAASRELGISRYSLYDWRRKVQRAAAGQGDCPTTGPDPADVEARRDKEILDLWRKHPGLGPSQIRNQLRRQGVKVAVNTVRRVMEDAGYRPPKVRRDAHTERYEAVRPNHLCALVNHHPPRNVEQAPGVGLM